jgi:hypothetical protein
MWPSLQKISVKLGFINFLGFVDSSGVLSGYSMLVEDMKSLTLFNQAMVTFAITV